MFISVFIYLIVRKYIYILGGNCEAFWEIYQFLGILCKKLYFSLKSKIFKLELATLLQTESEALGVHVMDIK
jgi:hypothetical protein